MSESILQREKSVGEKPLLLVSNDDGISSFFLRALVDALVNHYEVIVAAPASEQSWVGRSMTRSGSLKVMQVSDWPCTAWSITGRPADCVNIGINHLCTRKPDAVVSGMNLGFNTTLALTLSSGTVGAATEGALAGLPAIAFSLMIPHDEFLTVSKAHGYRGARDQVTRAAAQKARELVDQILSQPNIPLSVHNINFPAEVNAQSPVEQTTLALNQMPSLFALDQERTQQDFKAAQKSSSEGIYSFVFSKEWKFLNNPENSDLKTLQSGAISHTLINWGMISSSV